MRKSIFVLIFMLLIEKGQAIVHDMENALTEVNEKLASITEDKQRTIIAFSFSGAFGRKTALFNEYVRTGNSNQWYR